MHVRLFWSEWSENLLFGYKYLENKTCDYHIISLSMSRDIFGSTISFDEIRVCNSRKQSFNRMKHFTSCLCSHRTQECDFLFQPTSLYKTWFGIKIRNVPDECSSWLEWADLSGLRFWQELSCVFLFKAWYHIKLEKKWKFLTRKDVGKLKTEK